MPRTALCRDQITKREVKGVGSRPAQEGLECQKAGAAQNRTWLLTL